MPSTAVIKSLVSKDGTAVYADAVGDPARPHVVFIHGLSLSAGVWDDIFSDERYHAELYMASSLPRLFRVLVRC
jgi:pimeloyl-ACP methyl ester carboxylesterase